MRYGRLSSFLLATCLLAGVAAAQTPPAPTPPAPTPSIVDKTNGLLKLVGFVPMYWDARAGTLWLEIGRFDT